MDKICHLFTCQQSDGRSWRFCNINAVKKEKKAWLLSYQSTYPPQISIRIAVTIIYLCMQDCVPGNPKQVFVVAMFISIQKTEALTGTFNADFLGCLGFVFL